MTRGPYRILIVDDSAEDREIFRRLILRGIAGDHDYAVEEAEGGEAGLRKCRDEPPDCVLLDYSLPDLDGLEFLAAVRRENGYVSHRPHGHGVAEGLKHFLALKSAR